MRREIRSNDSTKTLSKLILDVLKEKQKEIMVSNKENKFSLTLYRNYSRNGFSEEKKTNNNKKIKLTIWINEDTVFYIKEQTVFTVSINNEGHFPYHELSKVSGSAFINLQFVNPQTFQKKFGIDTWIPDSE